MASPRRPPWTPPKSDISSACGINCACWSGKAVLPRPSGARLNRRLPNGSRGRPDRGESCARGQLSATSRGFAPMSSGRCRTAYVSLFRRRRDAAEGFGSSSAIRASYSLARSSRRFSVKGSACLARRRQRSACSFSVARSITHPSWGPWRLIIPLRRNGFPVGKMPLPFTPAGAFPCGTQ